MVVMPFLSVALAVVLYVASRTITKDSARRDAGVAAACVNGFDRECEEAAGVAPAA